MSGHYLLGWRSPEDDDVAQVLGVWSTEHEANAERDRMVADGEQPYFGHLVVQGWDGTDHQELSHD